MNNYLHPNQGGCWFCKTDEKGESFFSREFDCVVHTECLREAMKQGNPEAKIMDRELEMMEEL